MMHRRLFFIGASALTLSGCGKDLLGPPAPGPIYRVTPDFAPAPADAAKVHWALSVLIPDLPGALDTDRIALFQPDGTMDYYANATFPDRLPSLVQHALSDGFEASGRIAAVARGQDALHADYQLMTEIKDFEARYATQDGIPTAAVTIAAKLVTVHGRTIVGGFTARQTATATTNSAAAATQALQIALGAAVTEIVNWALAAGK